MERLVNYDTSGDNSPVKVVNAQPPTESLVFDEPIVSISVKGAGARSTSGQHTPPASSSGAVENKTPVKIQMPTKAHTLPRLPPTPSVPFSKGSESRGGFTVRGASGSAPSQELAQRSAPEMEEGEEGEVEEGETVAISEGPVEAVSVVVAQVRSEESVRRKCISCLISTVLPWPDALSA
ncbi:hypothetical protein QFC22_000346 [Naganishia vaughanmartiniae]|uniref:Uncharacterized protein n=1 Tax=Naganishia vaughanmartiniae TaxID=1424756 RepID=A0ACC2XPV2_9TREE|nr:hypothetical protein QFC22_000346 [Naganishia vaughanmartiniae]